MYVLTRQRGGEQHPDWTPARAMNLPCSLNKGFAPSLSAWDAHVGMVESLYNICVNLPPGWRLKIQQSGEGVPIHKLIFRGQVLVLYLYQPQTVQGESRLHLHEIITADQESERVSLPCGLLQKNNGPVDRLRGTEVRDLLPG